MLETVTELAPNQGMLCELSKEGDTRILWDRSMPGEVEVARNAFNKLVGEKGYSAYSVVGKNGEKGEVVTKFDPAAERLILAPRMVGG